MIVLHTTLHAESHTSSTYTVNDTTDAVDANIGDGICETATNNNTCTLRAAIQEANVSPDADIIILPAGVYDLSIAGGNEDNAATGDFDIRGELTIQGENPTTTVIDGNQLDRIFHMFEIAHVSIANVSIVNGEPTDGDTRGGGIFIVENVDIAPGTVTLDHVHLTNNKSSTGGGIYSLQTISITDSVISQNEADGTGGGMLGRIVHLSQTQVNENVGEVLGGGIIVDELHMVNSSVDGNRLRDNGSRSDGGGVFVSLSAEIHNSSISDNQIVDGKGGGLFIAVNANVTMTNSTVNGNINTAPSHNTGTKGGGMFSESFNTVTISDSTFHNNYSDVAGGGIHNEPEFGSGQMTLNRVTVSHNYASFHGGGIVNFEGNMQLVNVTISGNRAEGPLNREGGGIYSRGGSLTVNNSTIAENNARFGGGIYGSALIRNTIIANNFATAVNDQGIVDTNNCAGTIVSGGNNLIGDESCNFSSAGDLTNVDPQLFPLAATGTMTAIHALVPSSPAIDTGDNDSCATVDQRGVQRPFDGNSDNNAICDIGAYELNSFFDNFIYLPTLQKD